MATLHLNLADALTIFQLEITEMKRASHTHNEILSWLQEIGIRVSLSTLHRQLRDWGLRRRTKVTISDKLAERVNFYSTTLCSLTARLPAK